MDLSDATERGVLDDLLNTTLYLGLSSTTPTDAGGNITEPSTGSYARVEVESGDWAAATGTAPAKKSNDTQLDFPTATGDWLVGANLTYAVAFTASSGGTYLGCFRLRTPTPVLNGQTFSFLVGQLIAEAGNPGDAF